MRPQVTPVLSTVTSSAPLIMDSKQNPFNVGFGVVATATISYTVEHTFDDLLSGAYTEGTARWFPNATVAAATASANGNYAFPVTAIRLTVGSVTGGTAQMTVLQGSSQ